MSMLMQERQSRQTLSNVECHYCGYEPDADATSRRRCPKCGGSSWDMQAAADVKHAFASMQDEPSRAPGVTQIRFELHAHALAAYIFIGADGGRRRMVPLHKLRRDRWELVLALPPRTYRYRFYVDDGVRLLDFDAATSQTSMRHGVDATLTITSDLTTAA